MKKTVLACDFCGKTEHQVEALVKGPQVAICDKCTNIAKNIVDIARLEKVQAMLESLKEALDTLTVGAPSGEESK